MDNDESLGGVPLVVPSAIPWADLKQEHLEELLYWLLDAVGVRDLRWRRGGSNGGAPDGGRDLEGTFHQPTPFGEFQAQRWWVQAKGRSGTVEPVAVQSTLNNAAERSDVLVFATNTQFSNPTIDWVDEWQRRHPLPKVYLWQREALERQVCRHPSAAARLFSSALSPQGHLDLAASRFVNYAHYCSAKMLSDLWKDRSALRWTSLSRIAVVVGEAANGDLALRPWLADVSHEMMADILVNAIGNTLPHVTRAENVGVSTEPLVLGFAHIIMASSRLLGADLTARLVRDPWQGFEQHVVNRNEGMADVLHEYMTLPILERAATHLLDACTRKCSRISADLIDLSERQSKYYWRRFQESDAPYPSDNDSSTSFYVETPSAPCRVGFSVQGKRGCPILKPAVRVDTMNEIMEIFQRIIDDLIVHGKQNE